MFFNIDSKYVDGKSVLYYNKIFKLFSKLDSNQIQKFTLKIINKQFIKGVKGKTILIDAMSIMLGMNLDKKYYNEEELEKKALKLGFLRLMDIVLETNKH